MSNTEFRIHQIINEKLTEEEAKLMYDYLKIGKAEENKRKQIIEQWDIAAFVIIMLAVLIGTKLF